MCYSGTFKQREIAENLKYSYPLRFFVARLSEDEAINVDTSIGQVPRSRINTGCPINIRRLSVDCSDFKQKKKKKKKKKKKSNKKNSVKSANK